MSFSFTQLFGSALQRSRGRGAASAPPVAGASAASQPDAGASPLAKRREMVRLVLRDTLRRCGFDTGWVTADVLVGASRTQDVRLHVRLLVRHWDSGLMLHSMALQEEMRRRLQSLDAEAGQWVAGFAWQFALPEAADYPPLPDRQRAAAAPAVQQKPSSADARAQLDRMFDQADSAAGPGDRAFASTEPAGLH